MDKNQIKIDDLFRNRLSGGEEEERPGSWMAMRDLLDKELPVRSAFNWRRMFGFITAIVVATSVSVGGYKYYAYRANTGTAAHSPAVALLTPKNLTDLSATTAGSGTPATINNAKRLPAEDTQAPATATRPATRGTGRRTNSAAKTTNTPATGNQGANGTAASPATAGNKEPMGLQVAIARHTAGSADAVSGHAARRHYRHVPSGSEGPNGQPANEANTAPTAPGLIPAAVAADNRTAAGRMSGPSQPAEHTPDAMPKPGSFTAGTSLGSHPATRKPALPAAPADAAYNSQPAKPKANQPVFTLRKDTIQQIEIVYHATENPLTRKTQYKADTIARYKLVVDRRIPVMPMPSLVAAAGELPAGQEPVTRELLPAGTMAAGSVDAALDNNLVSLSKFKVSSKFHNAWANNAERLNRLVKEVSFSMARSQFYGGITGGFNASLFGANTLAGFQLGLTGLLAFNERWSIAGELKFYQRFNNGSAIDDNYIKAYDFIPGTISTIDGKQYQAYSWQEDKVTHNYNFTTVQTIEAPVTLRRNIGRIFGEAGINLMYAFAVNSEEIEKANGAPANINKLVPVGTTPEAISSGRPQVKLSDFGSRFGLGYAIGGGYQFTPALNANVKLVQNLWDNASSDGGRKVSRSLYQMPSIQLSVGYRFSQRRIIKPVQ